MKINEITETQAQVKRVTGNEIEIDQGDGVSTTIDTRKNPNAVEKDPRTGQVRLKRNNSGQNKTARTTVRPGDKIDPETLSNAN